MHLRNTYKQSSNHTRSRNTSKIKIKHFFFGIILHNQNIRIREIYKRGRTRNTPTAGRPDASAYHPYAPRLFQSRILSVLGSSRDPLPNRSTASPFFSNRKWDFPTDIMACHGLRHASFEFRKFTWIIQSLSHLKHSRLLFNTPTKYKRVLRFWGMFFFFAKYIRFSLCFIIICTLHHFPNNMPQIAQINSILNWLDGSEMLTT